MPARLRSFLYCGFPFHSCICRLLFIIVARFVSCIAVAIVGRQENRNDEENASFLFSTWNLCTRLTVCFQPFLPLLSSECCCFFLSILRPQVNEINCRAIKHNMNTRPIRTAPLLSMRVEGK